MEILEDNLTSYPVIPLRDIVVFPNMVVSFFVGREKSINALESVMEQDQKVVLLTQRNAELENPTSDDLHHFGVVAEVKQLLKLPDGTVKVLVEGNRRVQVRVLSDISGAFHASVVDLVDNIDEQDIRILIPALSDKFREYAKYNTAITAETINQLNTINDGLELLEFLVQNVSIEIDEKQKLLEENDLSVRLEKMFAMIEVEIDNILINKKIRDRVKSQMDKNQREYFLNEQIKAINKELGDDVSSELEEYKEKIKESRMSQEAKDKANSELKKLKSMPPISSESSVVRTFIEWLIDVPWKKRTKTNIDLEKAEEILNSEHYGLEKVKERILDYLAVGIRTKKVKGPILCLVGPPGVGKTSLGESIAKACGRKFVRMSLGGVRDEAEIRGHRRTYVGAMPGKIVQGMKKAGHSNPMFLLDEIDKMGSDHRGDPAAALLEVLDPSQNSTFADHYLEVDYDLSDVMFVTTANSYNMPEPLKDRMEIISLSGYTEDEKLEIAKRHLIPRAMEDNGIDESEMEIADTAIVHLIRHYTREAGVRKLQQEIQTLCRKSLRKIMGDGKESKIKITKKNLKDFAGVEKFTHNETEEKDAIGMVTGLAWTSVGGDVLHIESALVPGVGKIQKTGKLGDVMLESISAAETYIRSRAPELGILPGVYKKRDIHIHVPEGATPKDGPSAGIAMVTAMVSALTDNPVRKDVAMTGEVTLRGKVLAIGGLKEKLLAAYRSGIKTVLIPQENEKDLEEIPDNAKQGLKIIPVSDVDEVLKVALTNKIKSVKWENEDLSKITPSDSKNPVSSSSVQ
ncbi:MAG: endopeptidase La [Alphaproteobacteria bacterium]